MLRCVTAFLRYATKKVCRSSRNRVATRAVSISAATLRFLAGRPLTHPHCWAGPGRRRQVGASGALGHGYQQNSKARPSHAGERWKRHRAALERNSLTRPRRSRRLPSPVMLSETTDRCCTSAADLSSVQSAERSLVFAETEMLAGSEDMTGGGRRILARMAVHPFRAACARRCPPPSGTRRS
jgi:hypothetical protein